MSRRPDSASPRQSRPVGAPERDAAAVLNPGLVALARLLARMTAQDAHANAGPSAEAVTAPASQETPHDQD